MPDTTVPVWLRVGTLETCVGHLTVDEPPQDEPATLAASKVVELLRSVANEMERSASAEPA